MNKFVANFAGVTRRIRFPGRERLIRSIFPPERFRREPQTGSTILYEKEVQIHCDLSSYIEWCIFFKGCYEYGMAETIRSLLRQGNRAIDVGANVGAYTLIMAKAVGKGGSVDAFEPNSEVYERLLQNLRLNDLSDSVHAYRFALSKTFGSATFYLPGESSRNRGIGSLVKHCGLLDSTVEVPVETLDRVVWDWQRCDLIKVDTDGHDYAVLEGANRLISRFLPSLIFEFSAICWPDWQIHSARLHDWLTQLGYRFFKLDTYWGTIRPVVGTTFPEGNIIALHPETRRINA